MRVYRRYAEEFKSDALTLLARSDQTIPQVAQRLGINAWTLRDWYKASMAKRSAKKARSSSALPIPPDETDADRIKRLERELAAAQKQIASLEMDRAILKKAAAFFARESE
jgi:transposase